MTGPADMPGRATSLPEGGVREASVREALAIIEQDGLEKLSLRDVARRLGVSHQAPYKYFPTRDHLLAEVVGRCFDDFGQQLEAAAAAETDLETALMAMGARYLAFAAERPSAYRLMFAAPLPDGETHPEMAARASKAFRALHGAVLRLHRHHGREGPEALADQDALHLWATMHGLATILQHDSIRVLGIDPHVIAAAPLHAFISLSAALTPERCDPSDEVVQAFGPQPVRP